MEITDYPTATPDQLIEELEYWQDLDPRSAAQDAERTAHIDAITAALADADRHVVAALAGVLP